MTKDPPASDQARWRVGWESRPWSGSDDSLSRRQRLASRGPYQAAVPIELADISVQLPSWVVAESAEATAAIARFDAEIADLMPDAGPGAEVAPMAAVLLRTESASSSQIENITAGARALALATLQETSGPNAALVASNVDAMQRAIALADNIDEASILAAHGALLGDSAPGIAGRWRTEQVWIGGRGNSPHSAVFVPPHHDHVAAAMRDLVRFCARTDVAPFTQAAIAHAQFETIHPFPDGNGRVGRTLVHAMLRQAGVTRRLTVPVSAGLLTDTASYFGALTAYREGDASAIVVRFSDAAHVAVDSGRRLVSDLVQVHQAWSSVIRARRDAAVWKALGHVLRQPAITVQSLASAVGVTAPAAQIAIDQMVDAGILTQVNNARRNRVWVAPAVLAVLDDFAEKSRRPPSA